MSTSYLTTRQVMVPSPTEHTTSPPASDPTTPNSNTCAHGISYPTSKSSVSVAALSPTTQPPHTCEHGVSYPLRSTQPTFKTCAHGVAYPMANRNLTYNVPTPKTIRNRLEPKEGEVYEHGVSYPAYETCEHGVSYLSPAVNGPMEVEVGMRGDIRGGESADTDYSVTRTVASRCWPVFQGKHPEPGSRTAVQEVLDGSREVGMRGGHEGGGGLGGKEEEIKIVKTVRGSCVIGPLGMHTNKTMSDGGGGGGDEVR